MYPILHEFLSDRGGAVVFTCFGSWHWMYIALTFVGIGIMLWKLRGMDAQKRGKALARASAIAFGLYILDIFLMPIAYGYIDVEKLPFHVCTAMCVMCFLCPRVSGLRKYGSAAALLGFLSNFVYLIYPAGVMWHRVHPLCYRVVQTLLFHGIMTGSTLLLLLFGEALPTRKDIFRVTLGMTLWAWTGNVIFGGFEPEMNWFFLVRDPFGLLPGDLAPFVMPVMNMAVFSAVQLFLREIILRIRNRERF